jgi:hypothetical protein
LGTVTISACSDSSSGGPMTDTETPPMGAAAVEAWLAAGSYKNWKSEPAVHEARSPSPHGFNRIYSNKLISQNASGTSNWPKGAAAVKELYAAATSTSPAGYAVYLKTGTESNAGANWYWYERVPLDSPAPHDNAGVVADGWAGAERPCRSASLATTQPAATQRIRRRSAAAIRSTRPCSDSAPLALRRKKIRPLEILFGPAWLDPHAGIRKPSGGENNASIFRVFWGRDGTRSRAWPGGLTSV